MEHHLPRRAVQDRGYPSDFPEKTAGPRDRRVGGQVAAMQVPAMRETMELLGLALAASMIFLFMRGTRHEQHRRQRSRERREAMVAQWLGELTKLLVHRADATLDHALQHFRAV